MKKQLDAYISRNYKGLFYNVTFNRYFKEPKTIRIHEQYRVEAGKEISPYDDLVKEYALEYGFDWRLVVSQMYQESQFDPDARSFAGAQGLMQVMPRTARQFGFTDVHDPEQGIAAGMAYLEWLEDRFPGAWSWRRNCTSGSPPTTPAPATWKTPGGWRSGWARTRISGSTTWKPPCCCCRGRNTPARRASAMCAARNR